MNSETEKRIVRFRTLVQNRETGDVGTIVNEAYELLLDRRFGTDLLAQADQLASRAARSDRIPVLPALQQLFPEDFPKVTIRRYAAAIEFGIQSKLSAYEFKRELRDLGIVALAKRCDDWRQKRGPYRQKRSSQLDRAKTFLTEGEGRKRVRDHWNISEGEWVLLIGRAPKSKDARSSEIYIYKAIRERDLINQVILALYRRHKPIKRSPLKPPPVE